MPPTTERSASASWRLRLRGALALLGPPRCGDCRARIAPGETPHRRLGESLCPACEEALGLGGSALEPVGRSPWPVHAPLRYVGTGEAWVRRIKYPAPGIAGLDAEARGMLFALARDAAARLPAPDAIVPVPLHRSAYARREFNPALLFARALGRACGAPVWTRALAKVRPTRPQKGLGVADRQANVADAFVVPPRARPALARSPLVLLVDDVVTTGATLEACVRALAAGGLHRGGVAVCLARTPSRADSAPDRPQPLSRPGASG